MDHLHISLPPLRGKERALLCALLARPVVSKAQAIDAIWGSDPDGGPLDAAGNVKVYLKRLRQKLAPLGITITLVERGYRESSLYGIEGEALEALRAAIEARYGPDILRANRAA